MEALYFLAAVPATYVGTFIGRAWDKDRAIETLREQRASRQDGVLLWEDESSQWQDNSTWQQRKQAREGTDLDDYSEWECSRCDEVFGITPVTP